MGRVLSALFDLATVLLLFFLARRLFDWRVGLLASFLLALAVLDIQGSHYFAVDTFLTFFVTLTLWFTLDLAEGKGWHFIPGRRAQPGADHVLQGQRLPAGGASSLIGAWIGLRRRLAEEAGSDHATERVLAGLLLAGIVAFAVFRVAQPYAWAGPNYNGWDSLPEPWRERVSLFQKVPEPIRAVAHAQPAVDRRHRLGRGSADGRGRHALGPAVDRARPVGLSHGEHGPVGPGGAAGPGRLGGSPVGLRPALARLAPPPPGRSGSGIAAARCPWQQTAVGC